METTIQHISSFVDRWAPERTQMDFDNVGLLVGDPQARVDKIITCLDVTPDVVEEAVEWGADLIVAHHPLIFNKLDAVTPTDDHGRMIYKLIQNDIGVIAAHTNLDAARGGVSEVLARIIGLSDIEFLEANYQNRHKLIFDGDPDDHETIRSLLDQHRADHIRRTGLQDDSSRIRYEALVENHQLGSLVARLSDGPADPASIETHASDTPTPHTGMGAIGSYEDGGMKLDEFLEYVAGQLGSPAIRYSGSADRIRKVAVCGGAGVFLTSKAIDQGADAFITADVKYHDYFIEASNFILADVGHYESEIYIAVELQNQLTEAFEHVEVKTTSVTTNPMNVFIPDLESLSNTNKQTPT